ncbi:hypothetical protein GWK08_05835 [Leptobacterium flavescens]|uniref:Uncharacterized protein n=1 Tax=Leptobacterium flavescens TaxID=472055 RepID=A0A6P0UKK9_9FLAO|nr:hypothetical protein [Leptobacterium flavescens]NER12950.1 hypothetical protein [Leptobacterium flavescens]
MKNARSQSKLFLKKFRVAKLNRPDLILGGEGDGDGQGETIFTKTKTKPTVKPTTEKPVAQDGISEEG